MKEDILQIASDLREGHITSNEAKLQLLRLFGVSGSVLVDIDKQVEVLKKTIDNLMITFDDENDRIDYILDIVNEYRRQMTDYYR